MATSCTFKSHSNAKNAQTGVTSGSVSLADVVVNTSPNSSGGWNTATVTADKQRAIFVGATDAASMGIPQGWYENVGDHFRRQVLDSK